MADADDETARVRREQEEVRQNEVLRRIAKHNGTTVEFEREQALQKELGTKDVESAVAKRSAWAAATAAGQPSSHVVTGATGNAYSVPAATPGVANPWRGGIIAIWVLALLIGVILLAVGANDYAALDPESGHTDPGLVQMFSGSSLLTIGVVGFIAWMAAEMVLWKPRA